MARLSKSPLAVARVAYALALKTFPEYRHKYSPKKFSQPQLAACLVLKVFFKTDYRGICEILADSRELRHALELMFVPHYTTLQKAASRLMKKPGTDALLKKSVALAEAVQVKKKTVSLAALDSTGMESHHVSRYFVMRRRSSHSNHEGNIEETMYRRFPKMALAVDCRSLVILAVIPSWGPSPDILHFRDLLDASLAMTPIRAIAADAGYDAEHSHVFAREERGIETIIPNRVGRPTTKLPSGTYRRLMALHFDKKRYGKRWMVETVNSMIKRVMGSALTARSYWAQMREMGLIAFTFNVRLV